MPDYCDGWSPPDEPSPSSSSDTPSSKKIIFGKYELGRLLGRGSSAKVYHARNTRTNQSFAIKCVPKSRVLRSDLAANIVREISIMRRLRHPNIVRLNEVLASRDKIYFAMEYVRGGELFARLASKGRLTEDLARRYFRQLISAVGYCHSRGVFHRDLKPENLLLDEDGCRLMVTDFGLSAVAAEQLRHDGLFHTLCGTPAYVAPEILAKQGYDGAKVDVWSCGVILFVLVAGYLPFNDPNLMAMYKKIYRGEYRCPKWTSPELRHLISRLLDTSPSTRITIDAIINDPWFRKGLNDRELAEVVRFQFHHEEEEEEEEMGVSEWEKKRDGTGKRELNAFDIISFSSGFDLSTLFDPGAQKERFVVREAGEGILVKLEEVGKGEGLLVTREKNRGLGLVMRAGNGSLVVRAEVHRLSRELTVVEVGRPGGEETRGHARFWEEKLRPALRAMACKSTATRPPAPPGPEGQRPIIAPASISVEPV